MHDLVQQTQEDNLWELWLAKEFEEKTFTEFKKHNLRLTQSQKAQAITPEYEKQVFAFTDQFIKPASKGGEN